MKTIRNINMNIYVFEFFFLNIEIIFYFMS